MGHDTLMQADTAAYLVHNPGELGAAEAPETPVDNLFGSKMPWISTVTGKPGLSKDEDVHPVQNIGGVFTNSLFSVLGDMGVSDLYHLLRGMRQGPGRQYPVGYNPFYVDAMKPINDRFNGKMGAAIDLLKALKSKPDEDEEDPLEGVKRDYNTGLRAEAAHYMNGIGVGLEFYRRLPAGTPERVAMAEAERVLGNYDGATYRGIMNGIQVLASQPGRDRLVGRVGVSVDDAVRELKGAMLGMVQTNWRK